MWLLIVETKARLEMLEISSLERGEDICGIYFMSKDNR